MDFNRNWADYQAGFGNLSGEFWLGNDNLQTLTSDNSRGTWELRVDLEDWEGNTTFVRYQDFKISTDLYILSLGKYILASTGGDSLSRNNGQNFTTNDRDNDEKAEANCAVDRGGGWWYKQCGHTQLTGRYYQDQNHGTWLGIVWKSWLGSSYSLKKATVMIREKPLS